MLHGRVTEVTAGRARIGGGAVDFAGTVTDDGIYDGTRSCGGARRGRARSRDRLRPCAWAGASRGRCCCKGRWPVRASKETSARRACSWATRAWARWRDASPGRVTAAWPWTRAAGRRAWTSTLEGSLGRGRALRSRPRPDRASRRASTRSRAWPRTCPPPSASWPPAPLRVRGPLATPRALTAEADVRELLVLPARLPGQEPRAPPAASGRRSARGPAPGAVRAKGPTSRWRARRRSWATARSLSPCAAARTCAPSPS